VASAPAQKVDSPQTSTPIGAYSQAILRDGVLYMSGQLPVDADGNLVGRDDMTAQAEQALANVDALVRAAGGTRRDVVKLTVFLTDLSRRAEFAAVRRAWVQEPYPASSLIGVAGLVDPEWLVEVEAVAVIG
jgi:reactive intermediate/imine deaminase